MTNDEQIETGSKKSRGMAKASVALIATMYAIAKKTRPITGRGIGYKLFTAGFIPSMETKSMQRVYRLLKEAREQDLIPWSWIVDETRDLELSSSWTDPQQYLRTASRSYRRDMWQEQPERVEVWSEKGTVRGVLAPVLDELGVGFRVLHGFSGATTVHDVAEDDDGRALNVLYVGDFDPSGMFMSEADLPRRLERYGGAHVLIRRIALRAEDVASLPSFHASDKKKDPRYRWFIENYGNRCWELDAMDPNDLRERCRAEILERIEPTAWQRGERCAEAEQESLREFFAGWRGGAS
jgi:hypothetical protein